MTQPSVVIENIRSVLATKLGSAVREVRAIDGQYGNDGKDLKDFISIPSPAVIVTCLGFGLNSDFKPVTGIGHFVCWCVARLPAAPEKDTRGDVAADLAAALALFVDTELWNGKASKRAQKVRATNLHSTELATQGVALWSVDWIQSFEITPETVAAALNDLRKIHFTFDMGTAETPKIEAEQNNLQGVP
jgi:phage gp37-like protein